jgi:hypothetical protein
VESLEDFRRETRGNFARVHTRLDALQADVRDIKTDLAGVKTDLAGVKTDLAGVKTELAGVKTHMLVLHEDVIERIKWLGEQFNGGARKPPRRR